MEEQYNHIEHLVCAGQGTLYMVGVNLYNNPVKLALKF